MNVQIIPYGLLLPVINVLRSQNHYDRIDIQAVVSAMEGIRLQTDTIREVLRNKFDKAQKFINSGMGDIDGALNSIQQNAASIGSLPTEAPKKEEEDDRHGHM